MMERASQRDTALPAANHSVERGTNESYVPEIAKAKWKDRGLRRKSRRYSSFERATRLEIVRLA
jgi:hypothetical protein